MNNQIDQLQAQIDSLPVFEKEVADISYEQEVPNNALDYALVEEIGGMSYESENLIVLEDVEETTTNGVTYSIKNGVYNFSGTSTGPLFTSSQNIFLPKGTYTLKEFTNNSKYAFYIQEEDSGNSTTLMSVSGNKTTSTITTDRDWNCIMYVYINGTGIDMNGIVITPMLVKGSVVPTTFENGYTGFYNAKVERVAFEQKNLLPIVPRVIYDGTNDAGVYCELDKDGWYTLTKTGTDSGKSINFMTSSTNIPAGVYSFRVVFKDLYGQKIGTNIGSFVGLYNVTGDNNSENRAFTISYDSNKYGYVIQDVNLSYPLKNLYVWLSASLVINEPVTFKVQLVKNSFMNDSIAIPNENIAFSWIGINNEDGNYNCIRYNEEDAKYYYHNNVGSYTFTGNETFVEQTLNDGTTKRYTYLGLSKNIMPSLDANSLGIGKMESMEIVTGNEIYGRKKEGCSIGTSGYISFYLSNIQTVDEMKAYLTGKTIIYKLATPEVIDISSYMNDEYLQVQENGVVKFVNEKQKAVPNKITYAIKVV